MYRIGEFSYLFQVTIKTLRHYDKIGLFKPKEIDPFTGYRYYSDTQKSEFEKILKLKELGFSLEDIKTLKEELDEEKLNEKIKELEQEKTELIEKIGHLENLKNKGEIKMKYKIGMTYDRQLSAVGRYVVLEKRNKEEEEKYFKEIEKTLKKLKLKLYEKIIVTEEVSYKTEDVELFIGYAIVNPKKNYERFIKKLKKHNLDRYLYPQTDYLVAIDLKDESEIKDVCSEMQEYAVKNNIQTLGGFIESYDQREDEIRVYKFAHDLKRRSDIIIEKREEERKERLKKFILKNDEVIGTWKIKEILPVNVKFNPNKQKSDPETSLEILEIKENGETNIENTRWTEHVIAIKYQEKETFNYMRVKEIEGKEYLIINMYDLTMFYKNAEAMSYIYERVE